MITRRTLLALLGGYLLAACSPLATPTPQPTQTTIETGIPPTQQPTATPTIAPSPSPTYTPTALPTRTSTVTPHPTPTPEKITETAEGPKEYVTWNTIDGYTAPDGEKIGTVIPGKHFTILEQQGDWIYIALEAGGKGWIKKSDTAYGIVGTQPPEGEPTGNFLKEIVLANGQLVVENMGSKYGVAVTQYAKRPDGTVAQGSEAVKINSDYINEMFAKYGKGKVFKITFYDDINKFPFRSEGKVSDNFYRYGQDAGDNTIELHVGVYGESYNPSSGYDTETILHAINSNVIYFLMGNYDSIVNYTLNQGIPSDDLLKLEYPSKLTVTR